MKTKAGYMSACFLGLILVTAVFTAWNLIMPGKKIASDFARGLVVCNNMLPQLRFSCYRNMIEKSYAAFPSRLIPDTQHQFAQDAEGAFRSDNGVSYAIFGTNCHTFYHAAGDFFAAHSTSSAATDIPSMLAWCPSMCTSGCVMGLMKRVAFQHDYAADVLAAFYPACENKSKHQCAHEIGHLLHDKYIHPILDVLDDVSKKNFGLVMPPRSEGKATTQGSSLDAPFEECKRLLPKNEWPYCFTGIGHNLFLFSEFAPDGYKTSIAECQSKAISHRDDCYAFLIYRIGINAAGPKFLSGHPEEGNKICRDSLALMNRQDLASHCWLGVGGGIGLYVDSVYAFDDLTSGNLSEVKQGVLDFAKRCDASEHGFVDACFTGLMGTPFKKLYKTLNLYHERIERLKPILDDDFQVVG